MADDKDRLFNPVSYSDWDADAALQACVAEYQIMGTSYEEQTRQHLAQAAPAAARSIINIALYSHDERTRLRAAQYVVDRNLGRIPEALQNGNGKDPLEDLLADVVVTAESFTKES